MLYMSVMDTQKVFTINNNSVNNICDDFSYKCKNCIEQFPLNDVDDDEFFYIHYLLAEGRMELFKHYYN